MVTGPPKVKICGLTRLPDAELAVELGAWALGMIFFADSPRRCSPEEATAIATALRRRVHLCGVFVNAPLDTIAHTADEVGLDMIQLHGDEGPSFCGEVARRTGAHVIKAVQIAGPGDVRDLERYHVDYHLVDARGRRDDTRELRGGTGETFDWGLLARRHSRVPLVLSGGLTPENVAQALTLVTPFAVDSASGTEASPGRKDPARLRALFAAVGAAGAAEPAPAPVEGGAPA
jgi:phosphoribosylanthranilate isomerase